VLGGFFGSLGVPRHRTPTAEQLERALAALAELEVTHLAERVMTTLSTGEARRVLFARALVHDPAVLVLDEPTDGLDPAAQYHVLRAVSAIARAGHTVVLVTHHVSDIVPEVSRVVTLKDGRILHDGPKAKMLTDAPISELFGFPAHLEQRDGWYRLW